MMPVRARCLPDCGYAVLELAGETLYLRADHSLYWPIRDTLFVADTHFGKASVFRRAGMAVPAGTTDSDLERLGAAIEQTRAARVVILGDFMHARPAADTPWLARFGRWRERYAGIEFLVTCGNHDSPARLPADIGIDWQPGNLFDAPFVLRHEPTHDQRGPVLAGHLHPVVWLHDAGERLRLPVFWQTAQALVLPAFSSFAGGASVQPGAGERLFVVGGGQVIEAGAVPGR